MNRHLFDVSSKESDKFLQLIGVDSCSELAVVHVVGGESAELCIESRPHVLGDVME